MIDVLLNPPAVIWPLTFLLFLLVILHIVREELSPIVKAMVPPLAKNASANATTYAIAFAFGLSASLSAFYDMFKDLTTEQAAALSWWQIMACLAKILNPFVVASLAYVLKPFNPADGKTNGGTPPPFPVQTPTQ